MNNTGIVFGAILPHPPIMVPAVGGKRIKDASRTQGALETIAKKIKGLEKSIDTIVIITPHGAVTSAAVPVYTGHIFEGNFSTFGAPGASYSYKGDPEFGIYLVKECEGRGIAASRNPETVLDHGVLVPLHYSYALGVRKPILPIAVALWPLARLFEFGQAIQAAAVNKGKRIAFIASADLSHRLSPEAPSGFNPAGKQFDEKLVELVRSNDVKGILEFPADLAELAGQDALWSIAVLLGLVDGTGLKPEVLSYEGPFGVGYMVATYE